MQRCELRSKRIALPLTLTAIAIAGATVAACMRAPGAVPATPSVRAYDRALGLASFDTAWSLVNRRHFDTTFNGVDWDALRIELRPRAAAATSRDELRAVTREMLSRLRQSHFALIPEEAAGSLARATSSGDNDAALEAAAGPGDAGLEIRVLGGEFVVLRVAPGSGAARVGFRPGWILRRINDVQLAELLARMPVELNAANRHLRAALIAQSLLDGAEGSTVRAHADDGRGRVKQYTITLTRVQGEPVNFGNLPRVYTRFEQELDTAGGASIGYIAFSSWMPSIMRHFDSAVDAMRQADGIIIDLRGNLGGVGGLVMGTAGHFLDERISLGTMRMRNGDLRFVANPRRVTADGRRVVPFAGPVAILTDGLSASTSELFAGGMQDIGRARVFGDTTAGQALPALMERLPDGDVLYHATADLLTPSGRRLEGVGVAPDTVIALSRDDLLAGRDAPRLAAMRWIARQRQGNAR